jgi:hypothetical protein
VTDEQLIAVKDGGCATFDVADRLGIVNFVGVYAYTYDKDRVEDFCALITGSAELGCDEFAASKWDGAWRLSRLVVTSDQREVRMPDRAGT